MTSEAEGPSARPKAATDPVVAWLKTRWGQQLCFWGAFFAFLGAFGDDDGGSGRLAAAIVCVGLLFGGIALRALQIWASTRPVR